MKTVKRKKHKEAHREFLNQQIESFLSSGGEITKSVTKKQLYEKYMTSEKWLKKKRHEVYTLRGSKCEICEAKKSIQIHHNNYSRLSDEDVLEDLAVLCERCHYKFHKKKVAAKLPKTRSGGDCFLCSHGSHTNCDYRSTYIEKGLKICVFCLDLFKEEIKDFEKRVKKPNKHRVTTGSVANLGREKLKTKHKNYRRAGAIIRGNPFEGNEEYRKLNRAMKEMLLLFEKELSK